MNVLALILMVVGAVNWGLVGLFRFDLVASLFGSMTAFSRVVYALVGIAGIWGIVMLFQRNVRHMGEIAD